MNQRRERRESNSRKSGGRNKQRWKTLCVASTKFVKSNYDCNSFRPDNLVSFKHILNHYVDYVRKRYV